MKRNQLVVIAAFTSIVALLGCDRTIEDYSSHGDLAAGPNAGPGCESEVSPEGFDPPPYDVSCVESCGGMDGGKPFCVGCAMTIDCLVWSGNGPNGEAACIDGRCHFYCDDAHPCPYGLECVNACDSEPMSGECWALDPCAP